MCFFKGCLFENINPEVVYEFVIRIRHPLYDEIRGKFVCNRSVAVRCGFFSSITFRGLHFFSSITFRLELRKVPVNTFLDSYTNTVCKQRGIAEIKAHCFLEFLKMRGIFTKQFLVCVDFSLVRLLMISIKILWIFRFL